MKTKSILLWTGVACVAAFTGVYRSQAQQPGDGPRYSSDNRLLRPANYRSWVFLSSSLGLQYGPGTNPANPSFENVYVNPEAFRAFSQSGKWPDKTMFILEIRQALDKGTFAQGGRYQGNVVAVEASVKDDRFPEKWAYFAFTPQGDSARAISKDAGCFTCHSTNAAVENTFAQFYPAALDIARAKGTLNAAYLGAHPEHGSGAPPAAAAQAEPAKDADENGEVEDPVCAMAIAKKAAFAKLEHEGKTYYFCQKSCKDQFESDPKAFVKARK